MRKIEVHYWNFLKTISIILVVYCHMPLLNASWYNNYSQLLTFVAVPLFFMVHGAALFNKDFNGRKHLRRMVHFLTLSVFWRAVYLLFALWRGMLEYSSLKIVNVILYFMGNSMKGVPAGPLWFLRAMFACYLIFPILKCAYDSDKMRKYLKLMLAAMVILVMVRQELLLLQEGMAARGWIENEYSLSFLTKYNPVREWAVWYFVLGGFLHEQFYKEERQVSIGKLLLCGIVFLAGSFWMFIVKGLISGFSGTLYNDYSKYGIDGCYQSLALAVTVVSLFLLVLQMPFHNPAGNRLWKLIGRNTMIIYFVHYMCAYLLKDYIPYFQTHVGIVTNAEKALLLTGVGLVFGAFGKKIPIVRHMIA